MADQRKPKSQADIADTPISEIFEGRHPSPSEKQWAEKTLAPALEKGPEKPIGAASGVNLDENGHARFTTISGVPVRRLYTQADLPEDWNYEQYLNYPGQAP
jgi:methylmalonyl-CoA mutase N-terminal domain/subunit